MLSFSELYLQVRDKENRIYTDEEVLELPYLKAHIHSKEWKIRAINATLLRKYIQNNYPNNIRILEVGSGNGWLASFLSQIPNSLVTGIEVNPYELKQAQRLFKQENLTFQYKALTEVNFLSYDIVIFAASIQYFDDPQSIFNLIFSQNPHANIICIDSFWYKNENEVNQAKQRSEKYYTELGFKEMIHYYHHHSLELLKPYYFCTLNNNIFYKMKLKWLGLSLMPCILIKYKE